MYNVPTYAEDTLVAWISYNRIFTSALATTDPWTANGVVAGSTTGYYVWGKCRLTADRAKC